MDWITAAIEAYRAYEAGKGGTFKQVPEDPTQTALRQKVLGYVDNSPTRNLLADMLKQRLASANPGFQLPSSPTYNPNAGSGAAPKYDLSKLLPSLNGSGGNPGGIPGQTTYPATGPTISFPGGGAGGSGLPDTLPDMSGISNRGGPTDVTGQQLWEIAKKYGPAALAAYFGGPLGNIAMSLYKRLTGTGGNSGQPQMGVAPWTPEQRGGGRTDVTPGMIGQDAMNIWRQWENNLANGGMYGNAYGGRYAV